MAVNPDILHPVSLPGPTQRRVAVVGSGVAGLAAAWTLRRQGHHVELIESGEGLGGRCGIGRLGDRPVMFGGKNIGQHYTRLRAFLAEFGSADPWEPFGVNASRVTNGKMLTLDSKRPWRTVSSLMQLGRPADLARLSALAARVRSRPENRYLGAPYFVDLARRRDHAPLSAHFGADVVENFLLPVTMRQNGATPDEMFLGTLHTNIGTMLDTFDQLREGLHEAVDNFSKTVEVSLRSRVEGLVLRDGVVRGIRVAGPEGVEQREVDAVVIATPAHAAAPILREELPQLAGALDQVRYFPSTVLLIEYDRPVFGPERRALALDDGPCSNAGSYGMNDRHILRYTFSGPEARVPDPSPALVRQWLDQACERLEPWVPAIAQAQEVRSAQHHWPASYSGYVPYHGDFLNTVQAQVERVEGLALAGDYLLGVNLEASFRSGEQAAGRLTAGLTESATATGKAGGAGR